MHNLTALRRSGGFLHRAGRAACALLFVAGAVVPICRAVETHVWDQSDESDFSHGTTKQLSIRSDGRVTLSPEFKELDSTTIPYLWAIAQDSKGTVYYAGGAPTGASTKVMALRPGGKGKVFAELSALEVHALAVDSQDRVYAAVQPDAKVYRIGRDGKAQLFFDPKQKYIWSMAFDKSGNLFVATGETGLIYKVSPSGAGAEFARTEETHARSMIMDREGNLIVGTEPNGLVLRIRPNGESFVLYQTSKREVTCVAEHGGVIYASSVGNKGSNAQVSGPAPVLPANPPTISPAGQARVGAAPPSLPPAVGSLSVAVTGGSEVYRIERDGFSERIWQSQTDLVYAIAFDREGGPLLGTGNKGLIYRIDSQELSTQLLNAPPTQVTGFLEGEKGVVYAVTGNVGNLYSIGPELALTGTLESDVLDAGAFAYWGKAHVTADLHDGAITLEARSGNLNSPQHDWSPWTAVPVVATGGEIRSPAARFLQYRLTLAPAKNGESPVLRAVDIPFLAKNVAPRVAQIDIAPFNYRQSSGTSNLERTLTASGSPVTLSVPAVGQKRSSSSIGGNEGAAAAATLQYSKGYLTLRWSATDDDSDPLLFRVEIRNRKNGSWMTLKDKLQDRFYSFDTAALPDGEYVARITASDLPGNTPSEALSSSLESDPFTVDNTPPQIEDVKPAGSNDRKSVTFTVKDDLSWIDKCEYSVDGGEWVLLPPVNKVNDSQVLNFRLDLPPGKAIAVRVFDDADNVAVKQIAP